MMRSIVSTAIVLAGLAACSDRKVGGTDTGNGASVEAAPSAPALAGCDTAKKMTGRYQLVGVSFGMSPADVKQVLTCSGYKLTFPVEETDVRGWENNDRQSFRYDFAKEETGDYVRVFFDGPSGRKQSYHVAREVFFGSSNPPTLDAVGRQFDASYRTKGGVVKSKYGIEAYEYEFTDMPTPGISMQEAQRSCAQGVAGHQASSNFSSGAYAGPSNVRCGRYVGMEAIENGRNKDLAYVARYGVGNGPLGSELAKQRTDTAQAARDASDRAETERAKASGQLPTL